MQRRTTVLTTLLLSGLATAIPLAAQDLPAADAVIAKYVDAIGGKAAIESIDSVHIKGTMEMAGMTGDLDIFATTKGPKLLTNFSLPGVGVISQGYNGSVGWSDNPMTGPMLLDGKALEQMEEQADLKADLHYATRYPTRETVERAQFAGEEAYKLRLVDEDGKETFEFFGVESGLKLGFQGEQEDPNMGSVHVDVELSDYQDVGGLKMPMTVTTMVMSQPMIMRYQSIEPGGVQDETFVLPPKIQALVDASAGSSSPEAKSEAE